MKQERKKDGIKNEIKENYNLGERRRKLKKRKKRIKKGMREEDYNRQTVKEKEKFKSERKGLKKGMREEDYDRQTVRMNETRLQGANGKAK